MSLAHSLQVISAMTDLEAVKVKRSGRRGQFTRIKKRLDALIQDKELPSINQMDLDDLLSLCKETKTLHDALQQQFDQLRDADTSVSEADREEEIRKDEDCLQSASGLLHRITSYSQQEIYSCVKVLHFKLP